MTQDESPSASPTTLTLEQVLAQALTHLQAGQSRQAGLLYRAILQTEPRHPVANYNLGILALKSGQATEALPLLRVALEAAPDQALIWQAYIDALLMAGQDQAAGQMREQARQQGIVGLRVSREPAGLTPAALSFYLQGNDLHAQGRTAEAEACYRRALALRPDFAESHCRLGGVLRDQGQPAEAEDCYRQALRLKPLDVESWSRLGEVLMDLGRLDEGKACLLKAVELAPGAAMPLAAALLLLPYRPEDAHYAQLEAVYARRETLPPGERVQLNFAMGRALESCGEFDRAFSAYEEANRLHYQQHPFDDTLLERFVAHAREFFSTERFAQFARAGQEQARTPVFIVGMPRSGSTLIEQILASHPAVFGAGECTLMADLARQGAQWLQTAPTEVALEELRRLGREYIDQMWRLAPHASHICDKLPSNAFHLGLIHLMLPEAKIIHSRRDPMDTCFSCYAQQFRSGHGYSYEQTALGRQYLRYHTMLRHWHQVLPAGLILDMRYEALVAHPQDQARRLLNHLDLPWDPACLQFYQTRRTVETASVVQVRQPIYSSSVGRWKHFASHLQPLSAMLRGLY